jgi:hypothetical protein
MQFDDFKPAVPEYTGTVAVQVWNVLTW